MTLADPVESPPDVCHRFATAISRGRLDVALRCLTRDACLVTPDGTAMHGREAIGGVLAQLIAARVEVSIEVAAMLRAGDVALAHERWRIRSHGVEQEFVRSTRPTLVLRQVESRWKLAVAAPWGWGG
ncbi:MAG: YybH family protein [Solirubrobacterales bacterium]